MDTVFVPSRVTDALFFVALVGVTLTFKAIWTAWAIKATVWWSRLIRTQRARYVEVVLAEVLAAFATIPVLRAGSITQIRAGMLQWWEADIIGKAIVIGVLLMVMSPLFALMTMASIYRHPAAMAYRRGRNQYVSTASVRHGDPQVYVPAIAVDRALRTPYRVYNPV